MNPAAFWPMPTYFPGSVLCSQHGIPCSHRLWWAGARTLEPDTKGEDQKTQGDTRVSCPHPSGL